MYRDCLRLEVDLAVGASGQQIASSFNSSVAVADRMRRNPQSHPHPLSSCRSKRHLYGVAPCGRVVEYIV